jgi:hypothetical protein
MMTKQAWASLAMNRVGCSKEDAEIIAEVCIETPGVGVLHAAWELGISKKCRCATCDPKATPAMRGAITWTRDRWGR